MGELGSAGLISSIIPYLSISAWKTPRVSAGSLPAVQSVITLFSRFQFPGSAGLPPLLQRRPGFPGRRRASAFPESAGCSPRRLKRGSKQASIMESIQASDSCALGSIRASIQASEAFIAFSTCAFMRASEALIFSSNTLYINPAMACKSFSSSMGTTALCSHYKVQIPACQCSSGHFRQTYSSRMRPRKSAGPVLPLEPAASDRLSVQGPGVASSDFYMQELPDQ